LDGFLSYIKPESLIYPKYTNPLDMSSVQATRNDFLNNLNQLSSNMTKDNTVIVGVLAENPYAEMVGDVNSVYC
jgi:hypothetical protein